MTNQSKAYSFHLANQPSELSLQARTQFLELIPRLKPQVVSDLWNKAFPEFKLAVIQSFPKEILEGINDIKSYFDEKQKQYLEDPNSPYLHLLHRKLEEATGARPYDALELVSARPELREKTNAVVGHFLAAFQAGLIVKLIQSKLTTEFGDDPIRREFRCYAYIAEREDPALAATIQKWSETWNLNGDWCRDHAVAVLREWLSHPQLSSVGLYTTEQAMQRTGWAKAIHELAFASIESRFSAETAVYGIRGPEPVKFAWHRYNFELPGFNRLKESQKRYKQKALAQFELYLSETRRKPLLEVSSSDDEPRQIIEPYSEVLKQFRRALELHVRKTLEATDKSVRELVKAKRKPSLSKHVRWAVQFHVPPVNTLDEIVQFEYDAEAVADVLRDSNLTGLTRDEIGREFSHYGWETVDLALTFLLERGVAYTKHEDPTSRIIEALRAEGRDDLFGPYNSIDDEQKATAEINKRIDADYKKTGGVVVTRYFCAANKKVETPDRSVISRAVNDILMLVGLQNTSGSARIRAKSGRRKPEGNKEQLATKSCG